MEPIRLPKKKTISPFTLGFRPYLEDAEAFEQIVKSVGADKTQALREFFRDYIARLKNSQVPNRLTP
jgi:hypothetical protein